MHRGMRSEFESSPAVMYIHGDMYQLYHSCSREEMLLVESFSIHPGHHSATQAEHLSSLLPRHVT